MTRRLGLARCGMAAFALGLPTLAHADPTFRYYGQLNFGLFNVDDGTESKSFIADNDNSNTRVGFWIENELADQASLKANFETALGLFGSSQADINNTSFEFKWNRKELRKFEVIYDSPRIGTFSAGQGSMAGDGVTEADFSGTNVIAYVGIADLAGSFQFRPKNGVPSTTKIRDVFKSFDGARRFRVRYDTPDLSGFTLSVSGGREILAENDDRDFVDVAARYGADYGDFQVDARLGYIAVSSSPDLVAGSFGVKHRPTGLNFAASAGAQQDGGNDRYVYAKAGYQQQWFSVGKTGLSIDYYDGKNYVIDGSKSKSVGVAAVQYIEDYKIEAFVAYRTHKYDATGTNFEDINVFAVGARWKF